MKGKVQWYQSSTEVADREDCQLESTPEREARPPAGEDERPAAPLQDVGRGPPQAEAAR